MALTSSQVTIGEHNPVSSSRSRGSSNTLVPNGLFSRAKSTSESVKTADETHRNDDNKLTKPDAFGSVGNLEAIDSDDDIDGTFEKAKLVSQKRETALPVSLNERNRATKLSVCENIDTTVRLSRSLGFRQSCLFLHGHACKSD